MNNQTNAIETDTFRLLQQTADFDIAPYDFTKNAYQCVATTASFHDNG